MWAYGVFAQTNNIVALRFRCRFMVRTCLGFSVGSPIKPVVPNLVSRMLQKINVGASIGSPMVRRGARCTPGNVGKSRAVDLFASLLYGMVPYRYIENILNEFRHNGPFYIFH